MNYLIGEVSKLLGLSIPTLRYYDEKHMIPNLQKDSNGKRIFTEANITDIKIIQCLKKAGLSIKEIQDFMQLVSQGDDSLAERLEVFKIMRQNVLEEIADLEYTLQVVDYKISYYSKAVADGTEKYIKAGSKLPERNYK